MSLKRTSPLVINSSPKYSTSIPCWASWPNSIPECSRRSIESGAYMSSLCPSSRAQPAYDLSVLYDAATAAAGGREEADARCVELEVELPRALVWKVTLLVRKGDTELDELEEVDVAPHRLVVVVGTGLAVGSSQNEQSVRSELEKSQERRGTNKAPIGRATRPGNSVSCDKGKRGEEVSQSHLGQLRWATSLQTILLQPKLDENAP